MTDTFTLPCDAVYYSTTIPRGSIVEVHEWRDNQLTFVYDGVMRMIDFDAPEIKRRISND